MDRGQVERKIILLTLRHPERFLDDAIFALSAEHFKHPVCREVWEWIQSRYSAGESVGYAAAQHNLDVDLGDSFIDAAGTIHRHEYHQYLRILEKYYTKSELAAAAEDIQELVDANDMDPEELRARAQEIIYKSTSELAEEDDGIVDIETAISDIYARLTGDEPAQAGLATGFPGIDTQLGGLVPGHVTTLAAQTSMGKTTMACNIVRNIIKNDHTVAFISLEMGADELAEKFIIMEAQIPASNVSTGLEEHEMQNAMTAIDRIYDKDLLISDTRGLTPAEIKARLRKLDRQNNGLDLVVIDYLQLIDMSPYSNETTAKRVGYTVQDIRNMAGELDVPVILISQLNRNVDGRPKLKHLRDSGEIEEHSDEVWFLYRPLYQQELDDDQKRRRQEAELRFSKGRTKGTGVAYFSWYQEFQLFRDAYIEEKEGPLI